MRAGALRDLVTVEAHNGLELRSGEPDPQGWHEVATAWVGFAEQSGTLSETGGLEVASVTSTMHGRWVDLKGVNAGMRVRWVDGARVRLFVIESAVDVAERHDEMRIEVREVAPASNDPEAAGLPAEVGA